MKKFCLFATIAFALSTAISCTSDKVVIDTELPAGNIVFERMVGDTVYVHQQLRGSKKAWFYWAFRAKGCQGKRLTFVFTKSFALCERGPLVSLDKGKTYEYLAEDGATPYMYIYVSEKCQGGVVL